MGFLYFPNASTTVQYYTSSKSGNTERARKRALYNDILLMTCTLY